MYEMQVYMFKNHNKESEGKHWASIRATGGTPYQYKTRPEAQKMLDMCYPDCQREEKRVVNV